MFFDFEETDQQNTKKSRAWARAEFPMAGGVSTGRSIGTDLNCQVPTNEQQLPKYIDIHW